MASAECPTSNPSKCSSVSDVNQIGCPDCDPKYFHGPCCDKNSNCICDAYCGEGCDDGAYALPHEPVPIGEPDASCKVGAGTVGDVIWGLNWGGVRVCTSDGTAGGPLLTGLELAEACLAVCLADPQCRSFDIGSPKIADAYRIASWSGGHAYNCAIEYHRKTDPAVQSVRSIRAPVGSDAAQEANCWTNYQMEGDCTTRPEWAPDKAAKCFDPSAALLGGGVAGRSSIGFIEDWLDDGAMHDPIQDASYLARLYAIDADTCDGWTVDGAPDVHVTTPPSAPPPSSPSNVSTGTIVGIAVGGSVGLLVALGVVGVAVMKQKKKKEPPAQPAAGTAVSVVCGEPVAEPVGVQVQMTPAPASPAAKKLGPLGPEELAKLKELKELLDSNVLSQAEFDAQKKVILVNP